MRLVGQCNGLFEPEQLNLDSVSGRAAIVCYFFPESGRG